MHRIFYGWGITGVSALVDTLAWSVRATFALIGGIRAFRQPVAD